MTYLFELTDRLKNHSSKLDDFFLCLAENFNSVESHRIKIDEVGYNRFTMTPNKRKFDYKKIVYY